MRTIDADALKFKNVAEVNGILTHILTPEEIDNAPTVSEFSDVELFLIEMALDEVLWKLEVDSPMYKKFSLMNLKVHGLRKGAEIEK